MPYFRIEVTEVTRHSFWVKAPNEEAIRAMDVDDFADACSDNSGFMEVSERDITAVDAPREKLPAGVADAHVIVHERSHECDNCGTFWSEDELDEIRDIAQRLDPNGTVPSGQCPECGALCYADRL